jgi:predicted DNA-binding transcriptional regulator YafY
MRERLLRLTLLLTVVAWALAISFRVTQGSNAMFILAVALTVLTGIIALVPERSAPTEPRAAIGERDLGLLEQAIREKRDVSFTYAARDGSTTTRRVTPNDVFDVGDTPCLSAFCHLRNGERTFVLERVGPITLEGPSQPRDSTRYETR